MKQCKAVSRWCRWLLLSLLLCSMALPLRAEVATLLAEADAIKSADRARFAALMAQLDSQQHRFSAEQSGTYQYLQGYSAAIAGDFTNASRIFNQLIGADSTSDAAWRARATLVNILTVARRYNDAFSLAAEMTPLLDKAPTDNLAANKTQQQAYRVMALLHNAVGDYSSALFYSERVIAATPGPAALCQAWQLKIEAEFQLGRAGFADNAVTALASCQAAGESLFGSIVIVFQARQLMQQAQYPAALELLNAQLQQASATQYPPLIAAYHALIAQNYLQLQHLAQAQQHALQAVNSGIQSDFSEPLLWAYEVLYRLNKQQGQHQQALQYHEQFQRYDKAHLDNLSAGQLALNMARAVTQAKNQQIDLLNKDNQLLAMQQSMYQQQIAKERLLLLGLAGVLLLASALAYRGFAGRYRFKKIAEYDQLTGISNRYHFNSQAKAALEYCQMNNKPVAVFLFDLDYFKQINDEHGHAAGDWALQAVVKTCRNFMRNNDLFGRIGGEEFAVLLSGCQVEKALALADICRDAIAGINTADSGRQFALSASFGVSGSDTSGYQLKQLLADADSAMYQAKASGRDRVAAFSG